MKFQKLLFTFLVSFFAVEVTTDGINNISIIPTRFIGLNGENSMGHVGYIHLSTDSTIPKFELSGCQLDDNDSMCQFTIKNPKNEGSTLLIRAWTAVTLRENILSILGYLLHQLKLEFNENVESSLKLIYEQVRTNNIKIMEILPRVKPIIRLHKARRSVALFRALQTAMPNYCRGALEEVVRKFFHLTNKMIYNKTLENPASELGDYLLANIDVKVFPFLRSKNVRRSYDRALGSQFGKEYAIFFSAIKKGKIILTQPVLALIMSLTRFKELPAHENEDFKFLIDVLLFNKIPDWSPNNFTDLKIISSPYVLIKKMMQAIANHSTVDPVIKEIARNLQNHLISGYNVDHNKPMHKYFEKPELNTSFILESLEEMTPMLEVKMLWDMIDSGKINLNYALKGFNRFHYDTPEKLALAFVRRIQNRVPMDAETRESIQDIIFHLTKNLLDDDENYDDTQSRARRNIETINVHESYSSTVDDDDDDGDYTQSSLSQSCDTTDGCLTTISQTVSTWNDNETSRARKFETNCPIELPEPSLSLWLKNIDKPVTNLDPSLLFINVSKVLTIFMNDSTIKNLISNISNNENGRKHIANNVTSNIKLLHHTSRSLNHSDNERSIKEDEKHDHHSNNSKRSIQTKRNLLKRILKKMLNMAKVRARNVVYFEVIRVYCILIHGIGDHNATTLETDLQLDKHRSDDIIKKLSLIVSQPFKELINDRNLLTNSTSSNSIKSDITNRQFLVNLCKKLLTLSSVQNNDKLFDEIILLLREIQDLPIKFTDLMQHISSLKIEDFFQFRIVYDYLTEPKLLHALGDDFDIGRYPTKARLFKAIMEKIINHPTVKQNTSLSQAIESYIPKIMCNGRGAESTMDLLSIIEPELINIRRVIEYAVDKSKIDPTFEETVSNMWQWYAGTYNSMLSQRSMNSTLFESRADLIHGLLNVMESNIERDYTGIKKDIQLMRSAILKTGNGSAPVDYI